MTEGAAVTIAVPSANQGAYLADALTSIAAAGVTAEVFVADAGSTDNTRVVLEQWADRLAGWRSHVDRGQAAAINECIVRGSAPYVAWLNSDDRYLPGGLAVLAAGLTQHPEWPAAYGRVWNVDARLRRRSQVWVQPFSESWLANRCLISQPATLVRRAAWEAVGGLDEGLHMAFDYDLWWRLFRRFGPLGYLPQEVAENRVHRQSKTSTRRRRHYQEAMAVVLRHHGRVPVKWRLAWVVAVWARSLLVPQQR